MRKTATALLCFLSLNSYCQNTDTTNVESWVDGNIVHFDFKSIRVLDETIEGKWESRFETLHTDLIEFDIDPTLQSVNFILAVGYNPETVDAIVRRFGIDLYKISE